MSKPAFPSHQCTQFSKPGASSVIPAKMFSFLTQTNLQWFFFFEIACPINFFIGAHKCSFTNTDPVVANPMFWNVVRLRIAFSRKDFRLFRQTINLHNDVFSTASENRPTMAHFSISMFNRLAHSSICFRNNLCGIFVIVL